MLEELGYIPGRAQSNSRKSVVIFLEERGYIARRAWLYFCNENSGIPELLRWSHALCSDQFSVTEVEVNIVKQNKLNSVSKVCYM